MIFLKEVDFNPIPNYKRDTKKGIARWDAYLHVPDLNALAAEFSSRNVEFFKPLKDNDEGDDGLRGFEVKDADDISCPSDVPKAHSTKTFLLA